MKFFGRKIYQGSAVGEALVCGVGISFFGGVDPETAMIVEKGHPLQGQSVAGKVLMFPTGKGSTVGSYTLYRLSRSGLAPAAIINCECEPVTAVGCIISEIPCVDHIAIDQIHNGDMVRVEADQGLVEVLEGLY